ncbi:response regulator transcription factor [Sphingopyxis sp. QXT-31]|uniref:response regulator transcription factor n=1 Tax=Sphingopyxis sp. QXT-31 TaxID=1357916 RepID=UPI001E45FF24|nr:LuxR C-terminal-related transcriptional regulator [Sphingopyxis sp. QXT-31]
MSEDQGQIQLILPDAIERSACFRALVAGAPRVVRGFASGEDYLAAGAEAASGIIVMRWEQPDGGGAALLERLCGRADIVLLVAAERLSLAESRAILRSGAYDLLSAPLDPRAVRPAVDAATGEWRARREAEARRREAAARLAALTPREQDILEAIAAGLGNKAIARRLELSPRTVEVHRANIMRRAEAGSIAELLRLRFVAEAGDMVRSGA